MSAYDKFTADQKREYEDRARNIIYQGLEPVYSQHNRMMSIMSRAVPSR